MLVLTKENTGDELILTLTESVKLTAPYFLFVAKEITTKETVRFVLPTDLSPYPVRYNRFVINTSVLFQNAALGQWLYMVYEQASPTNTDETGLHEVENGKLKLVTTQAFSYTKYQPSTSYKTYAG